MANRKLAENIPCKEPIEFWTPNTKHFQALSIINIWLLTILAIFFLIHF